METSDGRLPSRKEAQDLLGAANQAELETQSPPLSWAFFVTQSVLLAAICCAQVLPLNVSRLVTIIGLVAVVAVGMRAVFARTGYGFVAPDGKAAFPYMIAMFVFVGVPAVLAIGLEFPWLWLLAGALASITTLEMGRRYRKTHDRD